MRSVLGAVGLLAGCAPEWRGTLDVSVLAEPDEVIVVGAGVSGLAAAAVLQQDGRTVTVLEARDRLGGRIHNVDVGGVSVDLGAAWIHGDRDNPLALLLDGLGQDWTPDESLARVPTVRDADGRLLETGDVRRAQGDAETALSWQEDARAALGVDDLSTAEVLEWYLDEYEIRGEEAELLRFMGNQILVELDTAGPSADTSAKSTWNAEEFPGGDQIPTQGYGALIAALAEGLDVRLSEPVLSVDWSDPSAVVLETTADTYTTTHVILTVPAGVLQRGDITFTPALPEARLALLDGVGMGGLEKVVLRFEQAFWGDAQTLGVMDTEAGRYPMCTDFSPHTGAPTLICFTGGAWSLEDRAAQSDEEILAGTLENLARSLGRDSVPEPTATAITRWASDPWVYGSYSYPQVGTTLADLEELGTPLDGRLLFAGEHTAGVHHQTVHGALLSGLREAARLGADPYSLPGLE